MGVIVYNTIRSKFSQKIGKTFLKFSDASKISIKFKSKNLFHFD